MIQVCVGQRRGRGLRRDPLRDRQYGHVDEVLFVVKVLAGGFEYESRRYRSLSAIAREVTGTRWNGLLFFGLAERRDA